MPPRGLLTVARIKALRWAALGVAGALAATIGVLWVLGHNAKIELEPSGADRPRGAPNAGKNFDQTITHEGKPLLRIRASRDQFDNQGNLHVEEVQITAYQDDGSRYEIAADVATYNLQEKEAKLEGNVSLAGPQGFALRTKKLTLRQGGRWLDSETQVNFQWGTDPPLMGRANELHAQINRGEFVLSGDFGVRAMRGGEGEPFSISAGKLLFQRSLHQLRADGNVILKYGRSHLSADRLAAHLSPSDNRLQFVRARWGVKATLHDQDANGRPSFLIADGDSLAVLFDESGKVPTRVEVEGDGKQRAHLRRGVENAETLDMLAANVEADLVLGRMTKAEASGAVALVEEGPEIAARRLTARTARAEVDPDGTLTLVEVQGDVHVVEAGRGDLRAARAIVTPDRTDAYGDPVRLDSPRGQLRAPQIVYTREGSLAHATGGVEAVLPPGKDNPMNETPLAETGEPVQVQAEEAFWRDEPRSFWFKGKVRAWSGDRVLRADQLRGEAPEQRLSAAGNVQSVWFMPPPKAGEATEEGSRPAGGRAAGPRQVRVDADTLVYSDREHRLVYDGNVEVVDGERTLRSKTLTVDLTEKGAARRMQATGDVKLEAPAEGRTITAERADYDVDTRRVVFRGSPVTLVDKKGGTLSGKQAVYSMATGKVRVTAEAEEVGP
jgi:lipopolysaccharide transport protein LptA/LPS export ABC transporter protein LptC